MTTEQQLQEAQEARHRLMTGSQVASITRGGKRVEFTRASLPELERYISSLKGGRRAIGISL